MRLTDDRINYLSHHIIRTLVREGLVSIADEAGTVQDVKKVMIKFIKAEEAIDQTVRTKIASIKRGIPEGSREWDVLYEQYYNEEMNKLK
ncbi:MAG: hypothetical protein A3I09_05180 [Deltaproteobacteria bacterium RIFCSPLOWO2_02_FULL_47_10]|nr:MAG: hypothetical protein A3I09_05180 [Deltaproteobacteria bacterium RIFCSPLOWO2_02_FULL_47_10]